jgi:hypothetical protein
MAVHRDSVSMSEVSIHNCPFVCMLLYKTALELKLAVEKAHQGVGVCPKKCSYSGD